jgi:uncharacterized protein (TIGR02588 family)
MALSLPDPGDTSPETWPAGRAGTSDSSIASPSACAAHEADDQATSRLDALRNRPAERRDASTGPHSGAEWITLAISSLIVLSLIGLTSYFYLTGSTAPASMEVEPRLAETYRAGGRYYLPITVRNTGGETGEEVRVRVSVADSSGHVETAEVMIAFLAGGGSSRAVAAFGSDPPQGQVEAVVVSYLEP